MFTLGAKRNTRNKNEEKTESHEPSVLKMGSTINPVGVPHRVATHKCLFYIQFGTDKVYFMIAY